MCGGLVGVLFGASLGTSLLFVITYSLAINDY